MEHPRQTWNEKQPSMKRRAAMNDYSDRQMYMVTLVTEGRRPLFGKVVGRSDAPMGSVDAPRMALSPMGEAVSRCFWQINHYHPEVVVVALQMMPDHLHGILFVKERMPQPLGRVILGFIQGCNKEYRRLFPSTPTEAAALVRPHTEQEGQGPAACASEAAALVRPHTETERPRTEHEGQERAACAGGAAACRNEAAALVRPHTAQEGQGPASVRCSALSKRKEGSKEKGLLFEHGYNDKLLLREGQLDIWRAYLADNPRRLLMRREHPDLFRVQHEIKAGGHTFAALGNRFLLSWPIILQVQCSRRLTAEEIEQRKQHFLQQAKNGVVLISPAISEGEKTIMRAALEAGFPVICLVENGLTEYSKPTGRTIDACAAGKLLLLAPWPHHTEQRTISREQCLQLNDMARAIATIHVDETDARH